MARGAKRPQQTPQDRMLLELLGLKPQQQVPASRRALGWLFEQIWAALKAHLLPHVPRSAWIIGGASLALLVLAVSAHQGAPRSWPLGALLMLGAPAVWWRARSLGQNARVVVTLAPVALGVWLALVWRDGPRGSLLLMLGAGALMVAGAYAWRGRGKSAPPRAANPKEVVARWATLTGDGKGKLVALAGSTVKIVERDEVGWTLQVTLAPGHTVEDIVPLAPRLASAIGGVARGTVSVTPDHARAERCLVRVRVRDPLAQVVKWSGPAVESVLAPIPLGPFEDGAPALLALLPQPGHGGSVLIAGATGQGKSGLLNLIVGSLAHCKDVVLAGIDPQGTELGPWEAVFEPGWLVTSAGDEVGDLLDTVLLLIQSRGRLMRERGVRVWTPTDKEPEIVIVADEAADLGEHMPKLFEVARKGRKFGIHLILATQRPSAKALGDMGTELRSQFRTVICLGVERVDDVGIVLGPARAAEGWRADQLCRAPGTFLITSPDPLHSRPRRARSYLVTDEMVQRWAAKCAPLRPRLEGR